MAAAFERARAALDRTPPLSSTVERVLQRCGSRADLLLETALNGLSDSSTALSRELFISAVVKCNDDQGLDLAGRPLLTALQQGGASCPHCSPLGRLLIQSTSQSGSLLEGLMTFKVIDGFRYDSSWTSSDMDVMLQLGPVLWEETDTVCGSYQEAVTGAGKALNATVAGPYQQDGETVPRLRVLDTQNPGFVLLYQVKKEQCTHRDDHLFSGDSVRQLIYRFFQAIGRGEFGLTSSGPATAVHTPQNIVQFDGMDMVPCLRANWWPSEEFFQRSRARDWPPAAARDEIRQFGIHLVPVGAKGSRTELHEFRLSFSRPEVVAAWHLLPPLRNSLKALKTCKATLGPDGKPVKSYYIKTALFWLCQESDVRQWTSIKRGMHMIIDFLDKAIDARYLGCFFWSEINLFRQSSAVDMAAMRRTLSLLRRNSTRLLAHELSPYIERVLAPIILREPSQQLSERQLRVCLARIMVARAVFEGISRAMSNALHFKSRLVQVLLRASANTELAFVLKGYRQQNSLFLALTVAPADVMARCRLTSLDDVMFSWDVAPLFELLTPEDLQMILGDPSAVHAWLKDQRRLSTGLSSSRAMTDFLLNPSLLGEVIRERVPCLWAAWQKEAQNKYPVLTKSREPSFDEVRRSELMIWNSSSTLDVFESLPRHGTQSALCQYRQSREKARQFLDDPQTRAEYDQLSRHLRDPWRLRQFVFTDCQ